MNLSDILDKIEPYLTQEELALVGQMETDLKEGDKTIEELEEEVRRLEQDVDESEDIIRELEQYKDSAEKAKLFRDPSNWDGNKFIPVLHYQRSDDPWNL